MKLSGWRWATLAVLFVLMFGQFVPFTFMPEPHDPPYIGATSCLFLLSMPIYYLPSAIAMLVLHTRSGSVIHFVCVVLWFAFLAYIVIRSAPRASMARDAER